MNPLHWQGIHQLGFVFAILFGATMGVYAGMGHFDPYTHLYWVNVGIWGGIGMGLGVVGGFILQFLRNRFSMSVSSF